MIKMKLQMFGGRGSGSRMASSGSSGSGSVSMNFAGGNVSLTPENMRDATMQYMNDLDKGTARMHAAYVVDGNPDYNDLSDGINNHGAWYLYRNAAQNVANNQVGNNSSRVNLDDINNATSSAQSKALQNAVRDAVREWYYNDSSTAAGKRAYKKIRNGGLIGYRDGKPTW